MPTTLSPVNRAAVEDLPMGCVGCGSRTLGICGALAGSELSELSQMSQRRSIPAGSRIGRGSSRSDTFGVVLSGAVSLSKSLPDGRHQIVALQFAPSFIGRPFRETEDTELNASGQVRICAFPRGRFETMLSHNRALEHRLLTETLNQLDDSRDWLIALGRKTAIERVATYLDMLASHARLAPAGGSAEIAMPLSRGEIADFLGLTIETVSRKMTELRKMGVIAFQSAASIRILSPSGLRQVSGT